MYTFSQTGDLNCANANRASTRKASHLDIIRINDKINEIVRSLDTIQTRIEESSSSRNLPTKKELYKQKGTILQITKNDDDNDET